MGRTMRTIMSEKVFQHHFITSQQKAATTTTTTITLPGCQSIEKLLQEMERIANTLVLIKKQSDTATATTATATSTTTSEATTTTPTPKTTASTKDVPRRSESVEPSPHSDSPILHEKLRNTIDKKKKKKSYGKVVGQEKCIKRKGPYDLRRMNK